MTACLWLFVQLRLNGLNNTNTSNKWYASAILKDTVTTDVQHHKIETNYNTNGVNTTKRFDAIVHHGIPIFACQNLQPHAFIGIFFCAIQATSSVQPKQFNSLLK